MQHLPREIVVFPRLTVSFRVVYKLGENSSDNKISLWVPITVELWTIQSHSCHVKDSMIRFLNQHIMFTVVVEIDRWYLGLRC